MKCFGPCADDESVSSKDLACYDASMCAPGTPVALTKRPALLPDDLPWPLALPRAAAGPALPLPLPARDTSHADHCSKLSTPTVALCSGK